MSSNHVGLFISLIYMGRATCHVSRREVSFDPGLSIFMETNLDVNAVEKKKSVEAIYLFKFSRAEGRGELRPHMFPVVIPELQEVIAPRLEVQHGLRLQHTSQNITLHHSGELRKQKLKSHLLRT